MTEWRAWWKSSDHWASIPKPPRSRWRTTRGSFRSLSAIRTRWRPRWALRTSTSRAELLQEGGGAGVDDGVHGVEAEAVEVVVAEPHQGVVAEEPADLVAVRAVEVERVAPGGVVAVGEVGGELRQEVARRPHVVVHDVEDHAELVGVAGVDQPLQPFGPAVVLAGGEEGDAVVAPAEVAGEVVDRHQLDVRHAERLEVRQPLDRRVERPLGGERADVQLVDQGRRERAGLVFVVGPIEVVVVDDPARPGHAVGLPAGPGVGEVRVVVDREGVILAGPGATRPGLPPAFHIGAGSMAIDSPPTLTETCFASGAQTR